MSYRGRGGDRDDYPRRGGRGGGYDRGGRGGSDRSGGYDRGGRGGSDRSGGYSRGGYDRGDGGGSRGRGRYEGSGRGGGGGPPPRRDLPPSTVNVSNIVETFKDMGIDSEPNIFVPNKGNVYGEFGETVPIVSNYFRVGSLPQVQFTQYRITFEPDIESIRVRSAIVHSQKEMFGEAYTFDGEILFLPKRLAQDVTTFNARRTMHGKREADAAPVAPVEDSGPEAVCVVTITFTNVVPANSPRVLQICNLIFKRNLKTLGYKQINRHYFDDRRKIEFTDYGLEIWPGVRSSFTSIGSNLVLCCDVAYHVVMRETALDRLKNIYNNRGNDDFITKAKQSLIGQVVMTRYNNASYRIDDIDFTLKTNDKFSLKSGQDISYVEYYKSRYNLDITDHGQPILISFPKKKREPNKKGESGLKSLDDAPVQAVHLIPELCCITGMSDEIRENFQLTRMVSDQTRLDPTQRSQVLVDIINSIYGNETTKNYMNNWGVKIENKLMSFPGRRYPSEQIYAGQDVAVQSQDGDWTRALRDLPLSSPAKMSNWMLVYSRRSSSEASNLVQQLIQISGRMGFVIAQPRTVEVHATNAGIIKDEIKHNYTSSCQLVMCILDSSKKDAYDAIKRLCCCELGVSSQVVLARTLKKNGLASIITKIGIQVNVKLGGGAWYVKIPMQKTMVVGIDVCHDPQSRKNSYGAMVCSMNAQHSRYYSCITVQHSQGEIIDSLSANFKSALQEYYKINNSYPDKVVVFRDGVGDGQFGVVESYEIPQFVENLKNLPGGQASSLAFVVVKKRITSRLFSPGTDKLTNPGPGTIVDHGITRADYPTFYLISQCVRQGTVNPTKFVILHNDSKLKTDHIQRLSYKLTHLYFNWSGTVRVPAPCQYAHKLCFIASNSVRHEPKRTLSHFLYYL